MCLKPPSIRRWKIGQKLVDYPTCPHPKVLQWGILAYLIRFRPLVLIINGFNRRGSCQKFNLRNPQDPPRLPQIHKVSLAFLPLGFHKVSCRQGYPQRAIVIFLLQMFVYWYMHNFLIYLKKVAGWNQIVCQKLRLSTSQVGSHEWNQYPVLIFLVRGAFHPLLSLPFTQLTKSLIARSPQWLPRVYDIVKESRPVVLFRVMSRYLLCRQAILE